MLNQLSLRHKEVEAALVAGFNPDYSDSFGSWDRSLKFEAIEKTIFLG